MGCGPPQADKAHGRVVYNSSLLGRSQVVRHRVLVPGCVGSNPTAPAKKNYKSRRGPPQADKAHEKPIHPSRILALSHGLLVYIGFCYNEIK